jgi:hypothetical protein
MVLYIALCLMPLFLALAWLCRIIALRHFANTPRHYFSSAIVVGILPSILMSLLLVVSSLRLYNGVCYGFNDAGRPCSLTEFFLDQTQWSLFISVPVLILNLPASLIIFLLGWKTR